MPSPLRQVLRNYAHLRRLSYNVHVGAIRPINSTARLNDTRLPPTLKPEVDIPKADENGSDPYKPIRTREKPALLRPAIFTLGIGICTFAGAAYLTQRESEELVQTSTITSALVGNLRHERIMRQLKHANATFTWLQEIGCPAFIPRSYAWLGGYWLNSSDGERVALSLVAVNTIVFLAWQIPLPAMRLFMVKHFMHHPLSGRSYTLLTSVFSHMNLLHFGVNMVALQSFVRESSWYIGSAESLDPSFRGIAEPDFFHLTDPNITYNVLAFFLTAGVFSMFGSHASNAVRLMRAKRQASDIKALSRVRNAFRPSLGASGAVYSTLILTALAVPDTAVQLLFLPFLTLPIKLGAAGLVTMDTVGIIRGWRVFDHYGHLSGAAFGGAYFFGGPYLWARTGQFLRSDKPLPNA